MKGTHTGFVNPESLADLGLRAYFRGQDLRRPEPVETDRQDGARRSRMTSEDRDPLDVEVDADDGMKT